MQHAPAMTITAVYNNSNAEPKSHFGGVLSAYLFPALPVLTLDTASGKKCP